MQFIMEEYPQLSIQNKCGFPPQPKELKLFPVEEHIFSPIIPFMSILELPVGGQQALNRMYMSCTC